MASLFSAEDESPQLVPQAVPPGLSHHGSSASLAHQGSGVPLLQHQGSGVPLSSFPGSGLPPLARQGSSGVLPLSHQGSGVPLLQHERSLPQGEWAAAVAVEGCVPPDLAGAPVSRRLCFGLPPPLPPPMPSRSAHQADPQAAPEAPSKAAAVAAAGVAAAAPGAEAAAAAAAAAVEGGMAASGMHLPGPQQGADGQQRGPKQRGAQPAAAPALDQPSVGSMLRMLAWVALLWVGYGFQRGLCAGGLPYDCDDITAADAFNTLSLLAFIGGGVGWLAGVARPARFAWLAAPRRAYLWVLYLAVLPAYSAIATLPALRVSLAGAGAWGPVPIVLKTLAFAAAFAAVAFHVWLAWRAGTSGASTAAAAAASGLETPPVAAVLAVPAAAVAPESPRSISRSSASDSDDSSSLSGGGTPSSSPCKKARSVAASDGSVRSGPGARAAQRRRRRAGWCGLALYLVPRLAVLAYFGVWLAALAGSGAYSLHVHHYALAWAVAIFAAFNHPVSGVVLALATAVFVQGAGAYGFDTMFHPTDTGNATGCLTVSSPPTGQMTCSFWSSQPFDIGFCSNSSWIPWFDCNVSWPWPESAIKGSRPIKPGVGRGNRTRAVPSAPKALAVLDDLDLAAVAGGMVSWKSAESMVAVPAAP